MTLTRRISVGWITPAENMDGPMVLVGQQWP